MRVQTPPTSLPTTITTTTPSFTQTMKEGLAFGTGAAVARNVVDRILSPSAPAPSAMQSKSCDQQWTAFNHCIKAQLPENTCQHSLELLNNCLKEQK